MDCKYKILARDDQIGKIFQLEGFSDLNLELLSFENRLCPSHYSNVVCVWEGYLKISFYIRSKYDEQLIDLQSNKKEYQKFKLENQTYRIKPCEYEVIDKSRDKTWIYFDLTSI